jgi:hypothetical protein
MTNAATYVRPSKSPSLEVLTKKHQHQIQFLSLLPTTPITTMSFPFFGGRKEPTTEEKYAIIETELESSVDTFQR